MAKTKKCGTCKKDLPETSKYFPKNPKGKNGLKSVCKKCTKIQRKKYLKSSPQALKYAHWYRHFADGYHMYRNYLYTTHRLREDDFREIIDRQKGCCDICGKSLVNPIFSKGDLHVDHCHKTNKVRGALCCNCNRLIGVALEDIKILENAIKYLRKHNE